MSLAWHTAMLTAYAPQKANKFQKLDTLLYSDKPTQRRQSPEEQIAIFKGILASKRKD